MVRVHHVPLPLLTPQFSAAWSVGVNLFVMLTGSFPFGTKARTSEELFKAIQHDPLVWTEQTVTLSLASRQLLVDLLQKDPTKRLTIDEALARPWVSGGGAVDVPLDRRLVEGLIAFNNRNQFRRHAIKLVAGAFAREEVAKLEENFRRINVSGSGMITHKQLVDSLSGLGRDMGPEAMAELLASVDADNDGLISWQVSP